ncbi:MAG: hypothetical protein IPM07_26360 [Anaerolineales bacterium]|nr:hypothetical protein [Anaerolineales bacterium]
MQTDSVRVITAPTVEPVTAAECKLDARVDNTVEDSLFAMWIAAARQEIEMVARRSLITRTLEVTMDAWPADGWLCLPYPPLLTVTQVTYYDAANAAVTWPADQYIVIADQEPGVIMPATGLWWPSGLHAWPRIRVRYTAGYGATAAAVPDYYKQDIRGLVKLQYDFRSGWTPEAERARAMIYAHAEMDRGW